MRSVGVLLVVLMAPVARADTERHAAVYVVRRGWHIDLGLAVPELAEPLASVARDFPGARYLIVGFGDRRYLLAKGWHIPTMVAAIWPGKALMLVTGLLRTPAEAFGETSVVKIEISGAQSKQLQEFIATSLQPGEGPAAPGPYGGSLFFDSQLRYSGFHTCNTWIAEGLESAHLPIHSRGVVFAGPLWRQVTRVSKNYRPEGGD